MPKQDVGTSQHRAVKYLVAHRSLLKKKKKCQVLVAPQWLFCDSMDCHPPGSSVHGILQARILEWAAILFSYSKTAMINQ